MLADTLTIQEVRAIAGYKTNNPNISTKEALVVMNSIMPDFCRQKINSLAVQSENSTNYIIDMTNSQAAESIYQNMVQKLGFEQPKTSAPAQYAMQGDEATQAKNISVNYLTSDISKALGLYQNINYGIFGEIYNQGKELFQTDFAASRIGRILATEELGAELLALSNAEQLTKKDYYEAKLALAIQLLPANAEEIDLLKQELGKLEPSRLNEFIERVATLPDDEYKAQATELKDKLIGQAKSDGAVSQDISQGFAVKNSNSVNALINASNSSGELMKFEDVFLKERGVEYNPQAVSDYSEKSAKLSLLTATFNKCNQIREALQSATITVDENNKYGAYPMVSSEACLNDLERRIVGVLQELYGNDTDKINDILMQNNARYADGRIDFQYAATKSYDLVKISRNIQRMANDSYNQILGDKSLQDYEVECKAAYRKAYGQTRGAELVEAFAESQIKGVQYIKAGVQTAGMILAIAGQIVPVAGSAAMVYSGSLLGTLGGTAIQVGESATKQGGITAEDRRAILQELAVTGALAGAGAASGRISSAVYSELVLKQCNNFVALGVKYGSDAAMSLIADYAITGDIDLTGEGISQLVAIISGMESTIPVRMLANKFHGGIQSESAKTYFEQNKKDLSPFAGITARNGGPLDGYQKMTDTQWEPVLQGIETPPSGLVHKSMMVYKKDSKDINTLLSAQKSGAVLPSRIEKNKDVIRKEIDDITAYLNTQKTTEPLTVYRDDDYIILSFITIPNGNKLSDELEAITKSKNFDKLNNLNKNFQENEYPFIQGRFLSTSLLENVHFAPNKAIRWEFSLPIGTKGSYVESYNNLFIHGKQAEFLVQRDSKIIIKNIEFIDDKWYIKADIVQE